MQSPHHIAYNILDDCGTIFMHNIPVQSINFIDPKILKKNLRYPMMDIKLFICNEGDRVLIEIMLPVNFFSDYLNLNDAYDFIVNILNNYKHESIDIQYGLPAISSDEEEEDVFTYSPQIRRNLDDYRLISSEEEESDDY